MSAPKRVRDHFAEAAAWRLLGLLLERPREGWHEEVETLAREVEDPAVREAAAAAGRASEGAYLALLGPGGTVTPREVGYRHREDPGRVVSKVSTFYEAFAFGPRAEDPVDHIAVEAGFVGYLALKEAWAESAGEEEAAATTAEAKARFLREHLGDFAAGMAEKLREAPQRHLAVAAAALAARAREAISGARAAP